MQLPLLEGMRQSAAYSIHPMTLVRDEKSLSGTVSYKYMMLILRTYNGSSRRFNLPIKQ